MKKIQIALAGLVLVLAAFFVVRSWTAHETKTRGGPGQAEADSAALRTIPDLGGAVVEYTSPQPNRKDDRGDYESAPREQNMGKLEEALGNYNRAIGLDPKFAKAWNNRGALKQARGDLDGAASDFNHAITFDPKSAKAFNNRGAIKQIKGDLDGAIADFTSAITLDPKYGKAYNNRGYAREARGDLDGAAADRRRAIELIPNRSGPGAGP